MNDHAWKLVSPGSKRTPGLRTARSTNEEVAVTSHVRKGTGMRRRYHPDLFPDPFSASILRSATPNALHHRVERPKHPNYKAIDKSGGYAKSPKVTDALIKAPFSLPFIPHR
jgi:hypothetical protein